MKYTIYILIGLLVLVIILIPGKRKSQIEMYKNYKKKKYIKNTLKNIPGFLPHLIL